MKIINKTTGKTVAEQCDIADTFLSRAIGLIFSGKKDKTIWFIFNDERIQPIHSLFVPREFTAVYVNSKMKVLEVWENVPYFKLYLAPKKPAKYLLESFKLKSIPTVGDVLLCLGGKS